MAEERQDENLLTRIKGFDLFACEAQYHSSCRKKYTKDPVVWRSTNAEQKQQQSESEYSHKTAFKVVSDLVDREIIIEGKVLR